MAEQFAKQYDIEIIGGDQKKRIAEMLRSNALNAPQGQMVSGWYVAPSWSQNLAHLANTAAGVYLGNQTEEEQRKKTAEALKRFEGVEEEVNIPGVTKMQGEGQSMPENAPMQSQANPAMMPRQTRLRPLNQDEQDLALMNLAQVNPNIAGVVGSLYGARATRAEKAEQNRLDRESRIDLARENMQGRMDLARMTAGMAAANRPERMLTVMDETGTPFTIPQSGFQPGMTLYNPATAKAFQERQAKSKGQEGVSGTLDVLKSQYETLNKENAIPSTQNKWGTNLGAKLATTGVGQWLGQVGGTKAQEARDLIAQTRPLLLADIKKATGMTASEMNSNAELQMWLSVATDPTKGYEANTEALKNLESKFGLGRGGLIAPQQSGGMPSQSSIDAEIARRQGR